MSSDREIPARREPQATREPASPWEHDPFDLLDPGEPRARSEPLLPGGSAAGGASPRATGMGLQPQESRAKQTEEPALQRAARPL